MTEAPRAPCPLRQARKGAVYEPENRPSADTEPASTWNLDFAASRTCGNNTFVAQAVLLMVVCYTAPRTKTPLIPRKVVILTLDGGGEETGPQRGEVTSLGSHGLLPLPHAYAGVHEHADMHTLCSLGDTSHMPSLSKCKTISTSGTKLT